MSLIQDALKRQQEESESHRVPLKVAPARPPATLGVALPAGNAEAVAPTLREVGASRPAPSVPDAMPVPPHPEPANQPLPEALPTNPMKPEQSGKSWKQIAGIIIFCILIVWSVGLLVVLVMKQSAERTLLGSFMPDMARGRVTLGKPSVKASPPPAYPPAAARTKPVVTPALARSSTPVPIPWISPAAMAAPAFAAEAEDDEDVVAPTVNEPELLPAAPAPTPVPVVWPRLKLSAIFSNVGSGQAGARLNNRLILLGDQIEGATLIEIRRDGVVLKCGAEVRFLKMGMTLN